MKRLIAFILVMVMALTMVVACNNNTNDNGAIEPKALKLGLGVVVAPSSTKASIDVSYAAVLVDEAGKVVECYIDALSVSATVAEGAITVPTEIKTKNEQGASYGMSANSGIGKEWFEQAAALADYCEGKTKAEIAGIAVGDDGKPTDDTVKSFATMAIPNLVDAVVKACENAADLGAKEGDTLKVASTTTASGKDATADAKGDFGLVVNVCAATVNAEGKVTAATIDTAEPKITFDAAGTFTAPADVRTKGEKGAEYGMKSSSGIGKEWDEQIEGFCAYITGKTASEIAGIAMAENGKTTDADLLTKATMAIAQYQTLVAKALK